MMDPVSLLIGAALMSSGWLLGRVNRHPKSASPVALNTCSCGHGYGTHEDGKRCGAQVERPYYWANGHRSGYEWVPCPCLAYDGPEPLPRVWTPGME